MTKTRAFQARFRTSTALLFIILFIGLNNNAVAAGPAVSIISDKAPGAPASHGLRKVEEVLNAKNISFERAVSIRQAKGKTILVAGLAAGDGVAAQLLRQAHRQVADSPEALSIWTTTQHEKTVWVVNGADERGLMYGLLDVADRIRWNSDPETPMREVKTITEKPDVNERAVSLFTMNRAYWESRFYDEDYWAGYFDMLAQNRFNAVMLIFGYENGGFMAPCYPYFFDVENFPGIHLDRISREQQAQNLDALNRMISMAHERGIRFSVGIWDHIYRGGVQDGGVSQTADSSAVPPAYRVFGVTADNMIPYTNAALARFIKLVPALDGIQFRMHNESGLKREEQDHFWQEVFRMVKTQAPSLRLDLRAKELPPSVIQHAIKEGVNFRITTKYWMEQMGLPYHPTQINPETSPIRHSYANLLHYPQQYKMLWSLWNGGTSRVLLWGDPAYAKRFAESTHLYDGDGFDIDEPLATKMEGQPHDAKPFSLLNPDHRYYQYEFERYWHFFQVFGRLGYNAQTSADVWEKEFELRFGAAGPFIGQALHRASQVLPRIVASVYPYKSFPMTRGWAEKQRLGDLPDYAMNEGSDIAQFANFDEEAQLLISKGETPKIRPAANSWWFEQASTDILELLSAAETAIGNKQNKEFVSTVTDLRILSNLALYHSKRIPAAVSYRLYQHTHQLSALKEAIQYEQAAIAAWRELVAAAGDVYASNLTMGACALDLCGHWKDELLKLENGLGELEKEAAAFRATGTQQQSVAAQYRPATAGKGEPAQLFQIIHERPVTLQAGKPMDIRVQVNASEGIKWVRLRYRAVNQELAYQTLAMEPAAGEDSFQAVVPASQIDPKNNFMYYIEVMDKKGNGMIYPDLTKETPYVFVKLIR